MATTLPPPENPQLSAEFSLHLSAGDKARGLFVTFEGWEATGKTTQVRILEERLRGTGRTVVAVEEPGTTPLGNYVRDWVKRRSGTTALAELLLFEAARAQLVEQVVRPALARRNIVLCDRFADSSTAYQGYGRGLPLQQVRHLNEIATAGLSPDLTILLDLGTERGESRIENQADFFVVTDPFGSRIDPDAQRRFEEEPQAFQSRVRNGYKTLAAQEPERWLVVDASLPREEIAEAIWVRVSALLWPDGGSG